MKFNADIKTFAKALTPFVIATFLFLVVLKFGFSKISDLNLRTNQTKQNIILLEQKLALLKEVDEATLSKSNISVTALPSENPALMTLSQLKLLASENGIILTNLKTSAETIDKSGLKKVELNFDVEAPRDLILNFLAQVKEFAPISVIEKVKINEAGGISRASVLVKSFSSELPETLPPITESFNDLTQSEIDKLNELSFLKIPIFASSLTPSNSVSSRTNPFED